jgi:hypothetical protein
MQLDWIIVPNRNRRPPAFPLRLRARDLEHRFAGGRIFSIWKVEGLGQQTELSWIGVRQRQALGTVLYPQGKRWEAVLWDQNVFQDITFEPIIVRNEVPVLGIAGNLEKDQWHRIWK